MAVMWSDRSGMSTGRRDEMDENGKAEMTVRRKYGWGRSREVDTKCMMWVRESKMNLW